MNEWIILYMNIRCGNQVYLIWSDICLFNYNYSLLYLRRRYKGVWLVLQTSFRRQSEPCLYISLFLRKEIRVLDSFALLRLKGSTSTKKITEREEDNIPHLLYIYIYKLFFYMFICGWEKRRLVVDILSCLSLSLKLLCNLSHSDGMSLLRIQTDFAQSFWRISRRNIYFSVHACASFVLCKRLVSIIKLFTSAFCLISSSFWACFNIPMLRI